MLFSRLPILLGLAAGLLLLPPVALAAPVAKPADALQQLRAMVSESGAHEAEAGRLVRGLLQNASDEQLIEAWGILEVFRRRLAAEHGVAVPDNAGPGFSVGLELARRDSVPADTVVSVLIREADLLRPSAQEFLAVLYEQKIEGFRHHDPRILQWFRRTADEGLLHSRRFLGRVLIYGLGVEQDVDAGRALLEGLETGEGLLDLAEYETAVGRRAAARQYLQRAAEEYGLARGWYNLGVDAKQEGNALQARRYFSQALELEPDFYPALIEQGLLLAAGAGGPRDTGQASAMMRRVVDEAPGQERYIAMANLGYFLMRGIGVAPDPVAAKALLQQAVAHGVDEARPLLQQLEQGR